MINQEVKNIYASQSGFEPIDYDEKIEDVIADEYGDDWLDDDPSYYMEIPLEDRE